MRSPLVPLVLACAGFTSLLSCGARTPLWDLETPEQEAGPSKEGGPSKEAGPSDSSVLDRTEEDSTIVYDAKPEADSSVIQDAKAEELDALDSEEAQVEAEPPLDLCPDAGATLVYAVSQAKELLSFYPPSASFQVLGHLDCPDTLSNFPWSMAVDRKGIAWVIFDNGHLYRVSTLTAKCTETPFKPNQYGFLTFGMGFMVNPEATKETLYVAESNYQYASKGLATINLQGFVLKPQSPFSLSFVAAELAGTADGRLYTYWMNDPVGSFLAEVDVSSGVLTQPQTLAVGGSDNGFAIAFWGGDFWIFTSHAQPPTGNVTRYHPQDKSETLVAQVPYPFVGAGVSTCAPAE